MRLDLTYLEDADIYQEVLQGLLMRAERSAWIATANLKGCLIEFNAAFRPVARVFEGLCARGAEVRLLHGGVPSEAFLRDLRAGSLLKEPLFSMRRCPRMHMKAVLADGKRVYLGSANLTGAGMGAKGKDRRNFECGFVTDSRFLIHQITRKFEHVWSGRACETCGRKAVCPAPLEQPDF